MARGQKRLNIAELEVWPLDSVVTINFGGDNISGAVDTGSEITVLKPSMIPLELLQNDCAKSTVNLQGAFGKAVPALLINIPATLVTGKPQHAVVLTCAVTDFLNQDVALVSLADYETLQES